MRRAALCLTLAVLVTTAAAASAGPTVYAGAGTAQNSTIQYFPPRAGAGVVVDFDVFTSDVPGAPIPVRNVIHFARGTRWNGRRFPQCDVSELRASGPSACPAGSLFARGYADALPLKHAPVQGFIGAVHGQDAQLFWVRPGVVIVGLISGNGGDSTETIDLTGLPLVEQFHVTDLRRELKDGTPLTVAPRTCRGGWEFTFTSRFAAGPDLVSTNRQPCVGAASAAAVR